MPRVVSFLGVMALVASTLACSSIEREGRRAVREARRASAGPLTSPVQTHCYGWPERQFDPQNNAGGVATRLKSGQPGADVTLKTVDGKSTTVSDLLALGKPVLLVTGSVTCPVFQEHHPELAKTAAKYKGRVTVATVYTLEAHPKDPEPSPYKGKPAPHEYSDRGQAMTLDARTANARSVTPGDGEQILVDDLAPGDENPFWCTYGTCANCAFLLGTDGKLAAVHDWYDPPTMEGSIDALLASPPPGG